MLQIYRCVYTVGHLILKQCFPYQINSQWSQDASRGAVLMQVGLKSLHAFALQMYDVIQLFTSLHPYPWDGDVFRDHATLQSLIRRRLQASSRLLYVVDD